MSTIAELLVARRGDTRPGIVADGRVWTWTEVVEECAAPAAMLAARRVDGPFHVGVLLENSAEYVFLLGGAALVGATVVGINPTRRGAELARDVTHTDCQLVVTEAALADLLDGADVGPVLNVDEAVYAEFVDRYRGSPLPESLPAADALYLLLFTSGSTGAPKAVRMTQGRAARTASASAAAFTPDDVLYCAMPLFHGNALLTNLWPALISGAQVVLRRRFSASSFLPDIQVHGCTFFNYVGRALSYIVALPATGTEGDNRLKWALGSEASRQDIAEFTRRYGCPIYEGYGSSENAVIIQPGPGMPPAAMGRPKPGTEVAIVDPETGTPCATAEFGAGGQLLNPGDAIGEIVGRRGAGVFEGYYNNPDAEAERIRDGDYWSGDLAYRDADGWIYFAGRSADWLRVDGENFAAAPVERIIARFPGLAGVAVYGVPDPVTGDQVMAAVEVASFDPAAFAAFLADQPDLGTKWAPRYVRVVDALPVTANGKVFKQPLRTLRWDGTDDVFLRDAGAYRPMTDEDRADLRRRFDAHGRLDQIEAR